MATTSASKGEDTEQEAILVFGKDGVGKSSFIAAATGADVCVTTTIGPCTKKCSAWEFNDGNGRLITLIDTPGFGGSGLEEIEVLRCITQYLQSNARLLIVGIVYLHPIIARRFTATDRRILQLLKNICGHEYYPNVVIATSFWNTAPELLYAELEERETQLSQAKDIWGDMIVKGSYCERFRDTAESSKNVLGICLRMARPPPLQVMSELRSGKRLERTIAYTTLIAEHRPRESFARRDSISAEEQAAEREAFIKEEVKRLEAELEEDFASGEIFSRANQTPKRSNDDHDNSSWRHSQMADSKEVFNVAVVVFQGADILDICGPVCFLSDIRYNDDPNNPEPAFKVHLIGDDPKVEIGAVPLTLKVEMSYQAALECLRFFDILVVPGGPGPVIHNLIHKPSSPVIEFIKAFCTPRPGDVHDPRILFSVCTGSLLLAAAGALTGVPATTHHQCLDEMRKIDGTINVISSVDKDQVTRYVDGGLSKDGIHIVTAGGVTCGLDGSLYVAELKVGRGPAERTAEINEHQWRRP